MMKLTNIEMIIHNGFYKIDDEDIAPQPHTEETVAMYQKGLEVAVQKFGLSKDGDIYEGVIYHNGKWLAQCCLEESDNLADYAEIK